MQNMRSTVGLLTFFAEFLLDSLFFCCSVEDVDFNESDLYPSEDSKEMRVSERWRKVRN